MSSRHPAKHVNLKSNTIMKKPRDKYKIKIKNYQIFSIKKSKNDYIYTAKGKIIKKTRKKKPTSYPRQAHPG